VWFATPGHDIETEIQEIEVLNLSVLKLEVLVPILSLLLSSPSVTIMTELSFAKAFLSTLDSRPIKLQSDHVADPKTFEPKGPYTLPRMPHPMRKRPKTTPSATGSITVSLKSLRNPPLDLSLPSQSLTASIYDLKTAVAEHLNAPGTEKIRILYNKKPCSDSKTIKDVIGDEAAEVAEFSVMVMGWTGGSPAPTLKAEGQAEAPVAQGPSGKEVLGSEEFWSDLKGFLMQRVRDEAEVEKAYEIFKKAWEEGRRQ